jgi:hypothetical protein
MLKAQEQKIALLGLNAPKQLDIKVRGPFSSPGSNPLADKPLEDRRLLLDRALERQRALELRNVTPTTTALAAVPALIIQEGTEE